MKMALILFLFPLFLIGVFGDDVESVSVMKEDSVTLHTGRNINKDEVFEWKHGDLFFAKVNCGKTGKIIVSVNETVKGRVQMDNQTGDLKIIKIKDSDSGHYKLFIEESPSKEFSLIVSAVDEVKSVSVTVGYSVTLNSGTIIQRDDVIQWRFADHNSPIAEHNRKNGNFSTSDGPDGRFRHRLQLDYSTGSLTIWKIGTNHSGLYEAGIRKNSGYTVHQSYSVTVTGKRKSALSVKKRDNVTLHTGLTEIHTDDLMQWMFEGNVIAEINKAHKQVPSYDDVPDGRFRDRLKLDNQTGNLAITDTRTEDSGLYELKIICSRFTIDKRITVIVSGESQPALSVKKRHSVTLHTGLTEIHTDDLMLWMFEGNVIAEINNADDRFSTYDDVLDGRFRGRLKLDHQTGNLTISDTRTEDSGHYELKIISSRFTIDKRFTVSVSALSQGEQAGISVVVVLLLAFAAAAAGVIYYRHRISELEELKRLPVMEGESVTITPYRTEIPKNDDILWMFGGAVIAVRIGSETTEYDDVLDGKFKGKLHLDKDSGYLTINDITITHSGRYELWSGRLGNKSLKTLRVSVFAKTDIETKSVKEGESVTLPSGVTGIQKDEQIVWKFGLDDSPIAQITDGTKKITIFGAGWRFRGRLELDYQTGSLTITKTKLKDSGFYVLYIFKTGNTLRKLIRFKVSDPTDNSKDSEENIGTINKPEEVPLRSV